MQDKFIDIVEKMDMSYSYKPVLLKAMFENIYDNGSIKVKDLVDYLIGYYKDGGEGG